MAPGEPPSDSLKRRSRNCGSRETPSASLKPPFRPSKIVGLVKRPRLRANALSGSRLNSDTANRGVQVSMERFCILPRSSQQGEIIPMNLLPQLYTSSGAAGGDVDHPLVGAFAVHLSRITFSLQWGGNIGTKVRGPPALPKILGFK